MPPVTILDVNWTSRPRSVAAALLESSGHHALIDPGPASTVDNLRAQLRNHGLTVNHLESILLTHIHLDHAGATGALVRENPRLRVYVHQIGAVHLADPSRLLASAGRLWGDELPRLFGTTLPVPEENIHALDGGEIINLGAGKLDVLYTPGHASHHVTYFNEQEGIAFAGDTAGIRIENGPYIMPATPPPDIDLALWNASFDAILSRRPTKLFLTHFGFSENPSEHIANFRNRLQEWSRITEEILASNQPDPASLASFLARTRAEMTQHLSPDEVDQYAFTAGLPLSFQGLSRHIRKRSAR
jgi:glyoxylase-like metal-dependent hydrolase (beta-lactamase superfamily II)